MSLPKHQHSIPFSGGNESFSTAATALHQCLAQQQHDSKDVRPMHGLELMSCQANCMTSLHVGKQLRKACQCNLYMEDAQIYLLICCIPVVLHRHIYQALAYLQHTT